MSWIMLEAGMYSAVAKTKDSSILVVRARAYRDVEQLQAWFEDEGKPVPDMVFPQRHTDYPWRVELEKSEWAEFVMDQLMKIDYTNFKSRIATVNAHRESVYHNVWADLLKIEDEDDPKKMKAYHELERKRKKQSYTTVSYASSLFNSPELGRDAELEPELDLRSIHDMTEDEWREMMEAESFASPIDEAPDYRPKKKKDRRRKKK